MPRPLEVASFWAGDRLSFFELVCIQSFLDADYGFHLYLHKPVDNVPDGVVVHDATEIYDMPLPEAEDVRLRSAIHADIFRTHLMLKTDFLWVDLDIYCAQPLEEEPDYIFGLFRRKNSVNNCVLRLPKWSPALRLMLNFYQSEVPIPIWWREQKLDKLFEAMKAGHVPRLETLPWTTTGPGVLTWALKLTGEIREGQFWRRYYQFQQAMDHEFLKTDIDVAEYEADEVRLVHLFGSTKIHIRDDFGGIPPHGSYVDAICKRHGIDPRTAPIGSFKAAAVPEPDRV